MSPPCAGALETPGNAGEARAPWLRLAAIGVALLAVGLSLAVQRPSLAILALGALHAVVLGFRPRWIPGLLAVDLGLVAWQSAHQAPDSFGFIYDSWVHMALVRRVTDFGVFPPNGFYMGHLASPLYSFVHLVYGAASAMLGTSVPGVWRWAPSAVLVFAGVVAWFAHREILRRDGPALIAAIAFVVQFRFAWGYAAYPRVVGPVFGLLAFGLLVRALRTGRVAPAIGAGAALGLTFGTHPVSGGIAALVVGGILVVEVGRGLRGPGARAALRASIVVVGTAIAVASPWLVADAIAWMDRIPGPASAEEGAFFAFLQKKALLRLEHVAWPVLPVLASVAGALSALSRPRDPLLLTYLAVASFLGAVVPVSILGDGIADLLGREYAMRFIEVFPLPALVGLAFGASDHLAPVRRRLPRAAGLSAAGLCVSVLLWNLAPWEKPLELPAPVSAKLVALEPFVRGRVVVAPSRVAYRLPALTGAFVAWNGVDNHGNRWIFDRRRKHGTALIVAGMVAPRHWGFGLDGWTDFMDRYGVERVVLRRARVAARRALVATGRLAVVAETGRYVVLEYRAAPAGSAALDSSISSGI